MYSAKGTELTYARLHEIAALCLESRHPVIVDATFLLEKERRLFISLGRQWGFPVVILYCKAPEKLLEERVRKRHLKGKDASEADVAVLRRQIRQFLPLSVREQSITLTIDTSSPSARESGIMEILRRVRTKRSC